MSDIRTGLYYSKDHEWVKVEGGNARIGISDHAQHELNDLAFIQLPKVGDKVKAGEVLGIVESVKNTADVISPVSGTVVEVNTPQVINKSPYDDGWIAVVKVDSPGDVLKLLDAPSYKKFLND
jgi:glycine cleavage system H protein